jgi:hypothetical protein
LMSWPIIWRIVATPRLFCLITWASVVCNCTLSLLRVAHQFLRSKCDYVIYLQNLDSLSGTVFASVRGMGCSKQCASLHVWMKLSFNPTGFSTLLRDFYVRVSYPSTPRAVSKRCDLGASEVSDPFQSISDVISLFCIIIHFGFEFVWRRNVRDIFDLTRIMGFC